MSKSSVLGSPKITQHLSRSGFNMSQSLKFTSSVGQLLPVYYDVLNPSEKIRFSADLFTRTQPLSTAAMVDIDEYVEFFFVPMKKIFSPFNQLITGIDDFTSSVFGNFGSQAYPPITTSGTFVLPIMAFGALPQAIDPSDYIVPQDSNSNYGNNFDAWYQGAIRLADMLGYNPDALAYLQDSESLDRDAEAAPYVGNYNPALSPALICAYQAIYYDYYRLSSWENNIPYAYNLDNCASSMSMFRANDFYRRKDMATNINPLYRLWQLHYRPYQRDYFKALEPSPLVSSTGILDNQFLIGSSFNAENLGSWLSGGAGIGGYDASGTGRSEVADVRSNRTSVASLATIYSYSKMLRVTGRSGRHYDDQILAHYGFNVPQGISDEVYYLGQLHSQVHIGEVISTASSDNVPLGTIAGKGYGKSVNKPREFTAPCHGVFMAIYSAVPRVNYQVGLDKVNTCLSRFDFYQPELDRLGMQPLYGYEFNTGRARQPVELQGWQWRYMQFKTKYDRSTGAFMTFEDSKEGRWQGAFRDWTVSFRGDRNGFGVNSIGFFLCSPMDLNQIMLLEYTPNNDISDYRSGYWRYDLYYRDPLLHDINFKVYKTSPMSTYGDLPLGV